MKPDSTVGGYAVLAIALLVVLASVFLLSPFGGFAFTDDAIHSKNVLLTLKNGRFSLTGFEIVWHLPQIAVGVAVSKIAGFSFAAMKVIGIVSFAGCMVLLFFLLADAGVSRAGLLAALVAFAAYPPLYFIIPTFMTDLPFMFFWLGAILFWERYLASGRTMHAAAGFLFAVLAVLQRQNGLNLAFAVLVLPLVGFFFRPRRAEWKNFAVLAASGLLVLVSYFAVKAWWDAVAVHHKKAHVFMHPMLLADLAVNSVRALMYLGLACFPLALLIRPSVRRSGRFVVGAALVLLVWVLWQGFAGNRMPYWSNIWSKYGLFNFDEVLLGGRPRIYGRFADWGLTLASWYGACGVMYSVAATLARWKKQYAAGATVPHGFFAMIVCSGCLVSLLLRGAVFDRYLICVLPALYIVMAQTVREQRALKSPRLGPALSIASAFALLLFSWTLEYDYLRWSEARETASADATASGIDPRFLRAGFEWWPLHNDWPDNVSLVPLKHFKAVVAFSGLPGMKTVKTFSYRSIWPPHDRQMHLLLPDASSAAKQ